MGLDLVNRFDGCTARNSFHPARYTAFRCPLHRHSRHTYVQAIKTKTTSNAMWNVAPTSYSSLFVSFRSIQVDIIFKTILVAQLSFILFMQNYRIIKNLISKRKIWSADLRRKSFLSNLDRSPCLVRDWRVFLILTLINTTQGVYFKFRRNEQFVTLCLHISLYRA